jgi:Flp pilus assembly protein TadD
MYDRDVIFATRAQCRWSLRRFGLMAAVLVTLAGCGTTQPPAETAVRPTAAQSQEAILTAVEADIDARRFQLAQQRLAGLNAETVATARARYAVAEVLLGLDRPKDALKEFEAVQTDEAFHARAWQGMGQALLAMGNTTAAISQLNSALEADPSLWRSWAALGRAYDIEKRWSEAAAAYDKGLAVCPNPALIVNNIGMSLLLQKQYAQAAAEFEKAMVQDPTLEAAKSNLRIALAWQGLYDQALAGLQQPERPDALNNVGYVAMLRGDYKEAQQYFSQALESSPTYHNSAAMNLEALRTLVKSKQPAQGPQSAGGSAP